MNTFGLRPEEAISCPQVGPVADASVSDLILSNPVCPVCKRPLAKVEQDPGSMLNEYQFASVRAGDYFCRHCTGSRGRTGYRYFWLKETLPSP
jgi:hypothetical protein